MASGLKFYRCRAETRVLTDSVEHAKMQFVKWIEATQLLSIYVICEEEAKSNYSPPPR